MRDYSIYELRELEEAYRSVSGSFKLYRGIDGAYAENDGIRPESCGNVFTTDDVGYAKVYAEDTERPTIIEYSVDPNSMEAATVGDLDDILGHEFETHELYDGLDCDSTEKVLSNGFNCVRFETEDRAHDIFYLLNRDMIVGRRVLSDDEYESVETDP